MEKNLENTMKLNIFQEDKIIKNTELKKFLQNKLEKTQIEKEDLNKIEEIILDGETIIGNKNKVYFEEIKLFPNLKNIIIKNIKVTNEDLNTLKQIEEISFENCQIEDIKILQNIKKISLNNCTIQNKEDMKYLTNLVQLKVVNTDIKNFDFLKNFSDLKKLTIKNVKDFSINKINFYLPIEYLSIEDIDTINKENILQYSNLKTLSIDKQKINEWNELINELKENQIKILLNDIYEY